MSETGRGSVGRLATRRHWSEAEGAEVVATWRRSGEPAARFARRHGLDPRRVRRWASRASEDGAPAVARIPSAVRFHPVRVVERGEPAGGPSGVREAIEIVLVDGRRVRVPTGVDLEDLRGVLGVLAGSGSC